MVCPGIFSRQSVILQGVRELGGFHNCVLMEQTPFAATSSCSCLYLQFYLVFQLFLTRSFARSVCSLIRFPIVLPAFVLSRYCSLISCSKMFLVILCSFFNLFFTLFFTLFLTCSLNCSLKCSFYTVYYIILYTFTLFFTSLFKIFVSVGEQAGVKTKELTEELNKEEIRK